MSPGSLGSGPYLWNGRGGSNPEPCKNHPGSPTRLEIGKKGSATPPNKKVEPARRKDKVPERLLLSPPRSTSKVEGGEWVFCLRRSIQEVRHD